MRCERLLREPFEKKTTYHDLSPKSVKVQDTLNL